MTVRWVHAGIAKTMVPFLAFTPTSHTPDNLTVLAVKDPAPVCLNSVLETHPYDHYTTSDLKLDGITANYFRIQAYRPKRNETDLDLLDEELRIYVQLSGGTTTTGDAFQVHFDLDHSHTINEGDYLVEVDRTSPSVYIIELGPGGVPTTPQPLPGPSPGPLPEPGNCLPASVQWAVNSAVPSSPSIWRAEIRIKAADVGLNEIPSIIYFHARSVENGVDTADYPAYKDLDSDACVNQQPNDCWVSIKTRYPLHYMIVLDQSGSMLSPNVPPQTKWDNARQAANFFANVMGIFREPSEFDDRLGLVTFSWDCSGADESATPINLAHPKASVVFPVGDYASDPPVSPPQSDNCTPIGRGLNEAFSASNLDASNSDDVVQKLRRVLLLSDGLQNRPELSIVPADAGPNTDPCPSVSDWNACVGDEEANVPVSAVAFGPDWAVDTDLLSGIEARYQGADFASQYYQSNDVEDLKEAFIDGLEGFYAANKVYAGPPGNFTVESGNDRLIVIASWTIPSQAQDIDLVPPSGTVVCPVPNSNTIIGSAICVVNDPTNGIWSAPAADGSFDGMPPDRLFAIVDLRLSARFRVDPVQPGIGDALLLTVELRDRGQPVLHDPPSRPVRVTVDIETPEEGVGTFAVTHEPITCRAIKPQLPADPVVTAMATPRASAQASPDPDPALFGLMGQLLDACNRTGLLRGDEGGLELPDDGTSGDERAEDGIYSRRFTNTHIVGTYLFRFNVRGTTADGEAFTRTKRFGKYVRFEADPDITVSDSRVVQQTGNVVVREYYVLPKWNDEYFGPGRAYKVDFVLDRGPGTFVTDVIDYGNGYYARRLEYDQSQGEPRVTAVVQGTRIEGPGPVEFGVFAGATFLASTLALDDGLVVGARLGYRIAGPVVVEAEGAVTFSEDAAGNSGQVIQLFGNVRYDLYRLRIGRLLPHITGGVGYAFFRGFGSSDEAFTYQFGGGGTVGLGSRLGLRVDGRVLRVNNVFGIGSTTNVQATGGLVWRF